MKLCAKYNKPTFVGRICPDENVKGSIRNSSNSELKSFKSYLDSTGLCSYVQGHDSASGCGIPITNIEKLLEVSNKDLAQYNFKESCFEVNFERDANDGDICHLIFDICSYNNIYGQGFNEPLIYITNVPINNVKIMGASKDTLKISYNGIDYLKFKASTMIEDLERNDCTLNLICRANINEYAGRRTP